MIRKILMTICMLMLTLAAALAIPIIDSKELSFNTVTEIPEIDPVWNAEKGLYTTITYVNGLPISTFTNDAGYITGFTEVDPIFSAHPSFGITNTLISNWNTAFSWGDHSLEGYITGTPWTSEGYITSSELQNYYNSTEIDSMFTNYYTIAELDLLFDNVTVDLSEYYNITELNNILSQYYNTTEVQNLLTNASNWDTAYSWGDHSLEGYITSYTETDPIFVGHPSFNITQLDIDNWNNGTGGGPSTDTLQNVTDRGNFTSHIIKVGGIGVGDDSARGNFDQIYIEHPTRTNLIMKAGATTMRIFAQDVTGVRGGILLNNPAGQLRFGTESNTIFDLVTNDQIHMRLGSNKRTSTGSGEQGNNQFQVNVLNGSGYSGVAVIFPDNANRAAFESTNSAGNKQFQAWTRSPITNNYDGFNIRHYAPESNSFYSIGMDISHLNNSRRALYFVPSSFTDSDIFFGSTSLAGSAGTRVNSINFVNVDSLVSLPVINSDVIVNGDIEVDNIEISGSVEMPEAVDIGLGNSITAFNDNSVLGYSNTITGSDTIAVGNDITASNSITVGRNIVNTGSGSGSLGNYHSNTHSNSFIIGNGQTYKNISSVSPNSLIVSMLPVGGAGGAPETLIHAEHFYGVRIGATSGENMIMTGNDLYVAGRVESAGGYRTGSSLGIYDTIDLTTATYIDVEGGIIVGWG